jgi:hypothetical protein
MWMDAAHRGSIALSQSPSEPVHGGMAQLQHWLAALYAAEGSSAVKDALDRYSLDPRRRVGALLGIDLSHVAIRRDSGADELLEGIGAEGAAVGGAVYLRSSLHGQSSWALEAHELAHMAQMGHASLAPETIEQVSQPGDAVEQNAETAAESITQFKPAPPPTRESAAASMMLRGKGKIIGWVVKVGERNLIKRAAIHTEKEAARLLAKGYNILVEDGSRIARRIAEKAWGKGAYRESGHVIQKSGKLGKPHYHNPLTHKSPIPLEKGWHIFYSALPLILLSEEAQATAVYEDKYPGQSIAHYLTVTQYVGEDHWLSYLDWVNPLELVAIGGDIGRGLDRERTKELEALILALPGKNGGMVHYVLDPTGQLTRVVAISSDGKERRFTPDEYFQMLANASSASQATSTVDGTKNANFAGIFDAEYRIYYSKSGTSVDRQTQSFYLPKQEAASLYKVGSYYVNESARIPYAYVIAHPSHRQVLRQPGFPLEGEMLSDFKQAQDKEAFLDGLLETALVYGIVRDFQK